LADGKGFYAHKLSMEQKRTVHKLLEHRAERCINMLLAPSGTGKTTVLDEVVMQVLNHHKEDTPASAL
jgi:hypothetical protein